jgi:hypothetical protein
MLQLIPSTAGWTPGRRRFGRQSQVAGQCAQQQPRTEGARQHRRRQKARTQTHTMFNHPK